MKLTKGIINERISYKGIKLIGDYTNLSTKSLFQCSKGHEWETIPKLPLKGHGCPECSGVMKLTKEIVNERIKDKNIKLIGDYLGAHTLTEFQCSKGHKWQARPNDVKRCNTKCPQCRKLTKGIINERIKNRGLKLIGNVSKGKNKSLFQCSKGHEWETRIDVVLSGFSCPICSNQPKLTKEIVNERLKDKNIKLIGDYSTSNDKSLFKCSKGHEWISKPSHIMKSGNCPHCVKHGFNGGKPAYLYYIKIENRIFTAFKIGITNRTVEERFKYERKAIITILKTWKHEKGKDAYNEEQRILNKFKQYKYKGGDLLTNGNTELFNKDILELDI